ncbi:MAG: hypothetical protein RLZZ76_363 [Candidatus Parcubacteria bacterium]|jgi:plastocyanin
MKNIQVIVACTFVVALTVGGYVYMRVGKGNVVQTLPEPTVVVTRTTTGYEPKEVTIKKGEVVLWKNESGDYHWPASDLHPTHAVYSAFDPLKPIADGQDWTFQFDQVGTWKYHDHIRANKVGTVTVVE